MNQYLAMKLEDLLKDFCKKEFVREDFVLIISNNGNKVEIESVSILVNDEELIDKIEDLELELESKNEEIDELEAELQELRNKL